MHHKTPANSKTIQTDLVLPGDTNSLNSLFGGELLARMDRVASIAAIKHSEQIVVTASVNNVAFGEPVPVGSILTIVVNGELTEEHPKYYNKVSIDYYFTGTELDKAKIEKAVNLSEERYCGVMKMFKAFTNISINIHLKE